MTIPPRGLMLAGVVAVLVRLLVFAASAQQPIVADRGTLISPRIANGTDLRFYQAWKNEIFSGIDAQSMTLRQRIQHRGAISGPIYPMLLKIFNYESGNTWPLALLFLAASVMLCLCWLWWLDRAGLSTVSLVLFALLPHPIYYMVCVGTEVPFSFLFAGFVISYFSVHQNRRQAATWMCLLLLLLLTRPNGLSVLVFVLVDQLGRRGIDFGIQRSHVLAVLLVAATLFGTFYYSYFTAVFSQAPSQPFFGISTGHFVDGLFPALPLWLNKLFSLMLLLASKMLYFLGIRPSHSGVSMVYVVARVVPGLLFLAGLCLLIANGDPRHQLLVLLFIVPILFVSSQDRYSVPIQPLLFLYFANALDARFRLRVVSPALQPAA